MTDLHRLIQDMTSPGWHEESEDPMMPQNISNRLFGFRFEKTSSEIKDKATAKIQSMNDKIAERTTRIARLREEYGIDDAALIQLLTAARQQDKAGRESFTYSSTAAGAGQAGSRMEERTISAGVVNHLLTENDFLEAERANVRRLETIVRNVRPLERHAAGTGAAYSEDAYGLSYEELEFLGF